jgi:hypothetical protein
VSVSESSSHAVLSLPTKADGLSARVVQDLAAGVLCCVVSIFARFLHKLMCGFWICPLT